MGRIFMWACTFLGLAISALATTPGQMRTNLDIYLSWPARHGVPLDADGVKWVIFALGLALVGIAQFSPSGAIRGALTGPAPGTPAALSAALKPKPPAPTPIIKPASGIPSDPYAHLVIRRRPGGKSVDYATARAEKVDRIEWGTLHPQISNPAILEWSDGSQFASIEDDVDHLVNVACPHETDHFSWRLCALDKKQRGQFRVGCYRVRISLVWGSNGRRKTVERDYFLHYDLGAGPKIVYLKPWIPEGRDALRQTAKDVRVRVEHRHGVGWRVTEDRWGWRMEPMPVCRIHGDTTLLFQQRNQEPRPIHDGDKVGRDAWLYCPSCPRYKADFGVSEYSHPGGRHWTLGQTRDEVRGHLLYQIGRAEAVPPQPLLGRPRLPKLWRDA